MLRRVTFVWAALLIWAVLPRLDVSGQQVRRELTFPDLPGYETLVCDFHMHTVFSDGSVWPPVRVDEAWRTGLDVIAITDHIEYQPHRDDVKTNFNRSYELAVGAARQKNILITRAAEITRSTPPGHFNALFLNDIEPLAVEGFLDAIEAANAQGAFVFWNHQAWKGEEAGAWREEHQIMLDKGWLHGMEVYNGESYYPTAHRWCLEKNLTMLGNSDIHAPDLRTQNTPSDHRTATLVFVEAGKRSIEGVHEALRARRTVVWGGERLVGREEWLRPLFDASVVVDPPHVRDGNGRAVFQVHNHAPVDVQLTRRSGGGPAELKIPAWGTILVTTRDAETPMAYTVANWWVAPDKGLDIEWRCPAKEE
ncbi:Sb-PDE family phosphodiesterase [Thermostilla marina]